MSAPDDVKRTQEIARANREANKKTIAPDGASFVRQVNPRLFEPSFQESGLPAPQGASWVRGHRGPAR